MKPYLQIKMHIAKELWQKYMAARTAICQGKCFMRTA